MKIHTHKYKENGVEYTYETIEHDDGSLSTTITTEYDLSVPAENVENWRVSESQLHWTDEQKKEIKEKLGE